MSDLAKEIYSESCNDFISWKEQMMFTSFNLYTPSAECTRAFK